MPDRILDRIAGLSGAELDQLELNATKALKRAQDSGNAARLAEAEAVVEAIRTERGRRTTIDIGEALSGDALVQAVTRAFTAIPLRDHERQLLDVVIQHPGSTSMQLGAAMKWNDKAWQMHFGLMVKERAYLLGPVPPSSDRVDEAGQPEPFYCGVLCTYDRETSGFTLKPEVLTALRCPGRAVERRREEAPLP